MIQLTEAQYERIVTQRMKLARACRAWIKLMEDMVMAGGAVEELAPVDLRLFAAQQKEAATISLEALAGEAEE